MKQATVNDTVSNASALVSASRIRGKVLNMSKRKVLFLCTGNPAAHKWPKRYCHAQLGYRKGRSAGTQPAGYVHPKALVALAEIGIQHQGRSKLADEFRDGGLRSGGHGLRRGG